jgi:hypothetical protein
MLPRNVRKSALFCSLAVVVAASVAFVRSGDAAPKPGLAHALVRTAKVHSQRYVFRVRITKDELPLSLRVRGQASERTISVHLAMGKVTLPDGTSVPGPWSAALLLGPFLYERAPSSVAVLGKLRWLRMRVDDLSPASPELKAVHALTPAPLLRVLGEARTTQAKPGSGLYRGTVAYDKPAVRVALARLTGGIEFRALKVSAWVAPDGLVHRLVLTGTTADGASTLEISARLFAFDRPLHVAPPKPGTFLDEHLAKLAA